MRPRIVTIGGRPVPVLPSPPVDFSIEFQSDLYSVYQAARARWDKSRLKDDPPSERLRREAMIAYNAWADASGLPRIQNPETWGFN